MSIEAMKQALEWIDAQPEPRMIRAGVICAALRQAIEQAEKQALVSSLYSIEPHGDGYAIYCGRDWQHHGMNIGHLTEVTPAAIKLIETALNQKTGQAEKQEPVAYIDHVSGKPKFINGYVVQTDYDIPLYTAPPRKEWVGLHWDDMPEEYAGNRSFLDGANWAESRLKEKNGG